MYLRQERAPTHMDLTVMEMARVANQILNEVKEMVKEMKVVAVMNGMRRRSSLKIFFSFSQQLQKEIDGLDIFLLQKPLAVLRNHLFS